MLEPLNRCMDRAVRVEFCGLGRRWGAFRLLGCTGTAMAVVLATALVARQGLSPAVMLVVSLSAMATFLALCMAAKLVVGREQIVYYHHEVAVLLMGAALLSLWHKPVLPYLDATLLGIGLFLAFGRVGCFLVGCCHGRPTTWGVRYRAEHAEAGFPACLVGVRMLPVQLVEAAWVAATVAVGSAMVVAGAPPGEALAWYSVVYGVGRFSLEFVRGDGRPYWGLFSEAQWTTLLLLLATATGEFAGILPFHAWHLALTGALILAMTVLALRGGAALRLLRGPHTREVAELLAAIGDADEGKVELGTTSLGLRLSASRLASGAGDVRLLAFSYTPRPLRDAEALRLGRLLRRLLGEGGEAGGLLRGRHGVFHLIAPARGSAHAL